MRIPSHSQIPARETGEEGRFKKWEFEEVEKCQGSCMAFPKVLDSASSALNEGLLPGLFPNSEVGRVQRSFSVPSLRARSTPTSEMPSPIARIPMLRWYHLRGRLPPGIFPNHQPGELLNVHRVFPSRSLRLACPEYLLSDGGTSSGRPPPDLSLSRQLGEVPYLQGMDRCGYSPPPERTLR